MRKQRERFLIHPSKCSSILMPSIETNVHVYVKTEERDGALFLLIGPQILMCVQRLSFVFLIKHFLD